MSKLFKSVVGLFALIAISAQAQSFSVVVSYPGLDVKKQTLNYDQPLRLANVIADATQPLTAEQYKAINWSLAKFGYSALDAKLAQRKQDVIGKLNTLRDYWQQRQRYSFVQSIERLTDDVKRWNLVSTISFGLEPDLLRLALDKNGLLTRNTSSQYHLILPAIGFSAQALGLDNQDAAADNEFKWLLAADGELAQVPVAMYNRSNSANCYAFNHYAPLDNQSAKPCWVSKQAVAHEFIGLSHNARTGRFESLNKDIAELAKFIVGYRK